MEISASPAKSVSLSCVSVFLVSSIALQVISGMCALCNRGPNNYWNCVWSYSSAVTAKHFHGTKEASKSNILCSFDGVPTNVLLQISGFPFFQCFSQCFQCSSNQLLTKIIKVCVSKLNRFPTYCLAKADSSNYRNSEGEKNGRSLKATLAKSLKLCKKVLSIYKQNVFFQFSCPFARLK